MVAFLSFYFRFLSDDYRMTIGWPSDDQMLSFFYWSYYILFYLNVYFNIIEYNYCFIYINKHIKLYLFCIFIKCNFYKILKTTTKRQHTTTCDNKTTTKRQQKRQHILANLKNSNYFFLKILKNSKNYLKKE